MYQNHGEFIRSIYSKSLPERKEPVRRVDSETKCLCSWNPARRPRRAIHVPGEWPYRRGSTGPRLLPHDANRKIQGDADRPRTAHLPPIDPRTNSHPDPITFDSSSEARRSDEDSRSSSWYDPLTALCAMSPNEKLDNVDIMVHDFALIRLLGIVQWKMRKRFRLPYAFDMLPINNTLVIQDQPKIKFPHTPKATSTQFRHIVWNAVTVPAPQVDNSSVHLQLLRYNIGPLSCVVNAKLRGTVQELPTIRGPSGPPKTRDIHGIDVITAGQGVLTPLSFRANVRRQPRVTSPKEEYKRLQKMAPHLWVGGQTKLGIADAITSGEETSVRELTVVEMGDLVRDFEKNSQYGLHLLVGFLEVLRDTVRAHGGPCTAVFDKTEADPGRGPPSVHVYSAGPGKFPILLDWHKEQFWSQTNSLNRHDGHQEKVIDEDARPRKGFTGKWASWLGF